MYCLVNLLVLVMIKCCASVTLLGLFLLPKMHDAVLGKSGQNKSSHLNWDVGIHIMVFHC